MTKAFQCNCGFDLETLANDEANAARSGQRRVMVTCPRCESIHDFVVIWTPTVRPEPVAAIVTVKEIS